MSRFTHVAGGASACFAFVGALHQHVVASTGCAAGFPAVALIGHDAQGGRHTEARHSMRRVFYSIRLDKQAQDEGQEERRVVTRHDVVYEVDTQPDPALYCAAIRSIHVTTRRLTAIRFRGINKVHEIIIGIDFV